jgi:hypothetical protein
MKIWSLVLIAWCAVVAQPALRAERAKHDERARIRAHLTRVEADLRATDVSALGAERRAARSRHLDRLREYRRRGVFPHNHDLAVRTPCFVDRHGTPCAMAYLIAESGGGALVERVKRDANLARIRELERDPELVAWLDGAGLTAAEAARVQPSYDGHGLGYDDETSGFSPTTTATIAILELAGVLANLGPAERDDSGGRIFGRVVGFVGTGLGAVLLLEKDPDSRPQGTILAIGGVLSLAAAGRGVEQPAEPRRARDPHEGSVMRSLDSQRPTLAAGVRLDDSGRPQLAVRMGF